EVRHELEIAELPGNVHSRTQGAKLTIDCTTIRSIGFSLIDVCLQNASSDALDLVSGKESVQVHQPPNIGFFLLRFLVELRPQTAAFLRNIEIQQTLPNIFIGEIVRNGWVSSLSDFLSPVVEHGLRYGFQF